MSTSDTAAPERVAEPPPERRVAAAVLFVHEDPASLAVAAVRGQVYETTRVTLVGGGEAGRALADAESLEYRETIADLVGNLDTADEYVWIVHGDARPRRDALGALVFEAERNQAGVVGSKILDAGDARMLESIGSATDVFGEPYTGLDPGEVDLEQYDVVRDVAYVSGVSLLVRRDLLKGLGGTDPKLPPVAAGLDFSQRARVAGARVMVAPSSEVLHSRECGHDVATWKELAGRQRAMMKAYRWVTLLWVIPLGLLLGFLDGLARLLIGKVDVLANVVRAVAWNLYHLPSTLLARRSVAKVRVTKDEELFRYQVAGSIRLRSAGATLAERLGWVIDEEPGVVPEEELEPDDGRTASLILSILGAVVVAVGARALWFGTPPANGFSLPAAADAGSVLSSYAGGWNPTGLGSPDPIHPAAAAVALSQSVFLGWTGAQAVLTIVSMLAGYFGIGRLAKRVGITGGARHLAGIVYLLGPLAMAMTRATHWSGLLALGGVPLLIEVSMSSRRWFGRLGLLVLVAFLSVPFAPMTAVVVVLAVLLGALVLPGVRWGSVVWALVAAAAGALLIGPTLFAASAEDLWAGGSPFELGPGAIAAGFAAVALLGTIAGVRSWRVAIWAGLLIAAAMAVPTIPGAGLEPHLAAAVMGSLGLAMLVAAAFDSDGDRNWLGYAAGVGALGLLAISLAPIPNGRAGLPEDEWGRRLAFVASLAPPTGPDRILVVGTPESLPGDHRLADGFAYRLVNGGMPTLDQAHLPDARLGDDALAEAIDNVMLAESARPGRLLAPFAVRWIVVVGDAPLAAVLDEQVDLKPIPVTRDVSVFENLAVVPRAVSDVGTVWTSGRVHAQGPAGTGRLLLADNASARWGPGWSQNGWSNSVSLEEGVTSYLPSSLPRALGWEALVILIAAVPLAVFGRKERR